MQMMLHFMSCILVVWLSIYSGLFQHDNTRNWDLVMYAVLAEQSEVVESRVNFISPSQNFIAWTREQKSAWVPSVNGLWKYVMLQRW